MRDFRNFMEGVIRGEIYRESNLLQILSKMTNEEKIRFGLYCARDVEHLADNSSISNNKVEEWLNGGKKGEFFPSKDTASSQFRDTAGYYAGICANHLSDSISYYNKEESAITSRINKCVRCASQAKAWGENLKTQAERDTMQEYYYHEYEEIARRWRSYWEHPSDNLRLISSGDNFNQIFFDLLQDEEETRNAIIPWDGKQYYLNIHGYEGSYVGKSQDEVIEQILSSPERRRIISLIKGMIR